jgi:uncharacterized protein YcbX
MPEQAHFVGHIAELWRYPVKSMQGETVENTTLTERGVLGDRGYAIIDRATGNVASAKNPRKWQQLWACRSTYVEPPRLDGPLPPVEITFPDGTVTRSDQPTINQLLSSLVGRDVVLTTLPPPTPQRETLAVDAASAPEEAMVRTDPLALAAPGTFFDFAPIHVLTTATLDHLRSLEPAARWDVRRFRPNIVIATSTYTRGFAENEWLAHVLATENGVRLRVSDPTPRCVVTTLAQNDLPHDPQILRTAARHNAVASTTFAPDVLFPAVVGVYGHISECGSVRCGDAIMLDLE